MELISNGYEPIIAHAERYPVIRKESGTSRTAGGYGAHTYR